MLHSLGVVSRCSPCQMIAYVSNDAKCKLYLFTQFYRSYQDHTLRPKDQSDGIHSGITMGVQRGADTAGCNTRRHKFSFQQYVLNDLNCIVKFNILH